MRRRVFWIVLSLILAAVVHIAYILFIPSQRFADTIEAVLQDHGTNTFVIPDPAQQAALLPFTTASDLVGIYMFDLSEGPVNVAMQVPRGYWTFAVYTIRGRQVYGLNDKQADGQEFTVGLEPQGGILGQILGISLDDDNRLGQDIGWHVQIEDKRGIAVFWMPMADPLLRGEASARLSKSRCTKSE